MTTPPSITSKGVKIRLSRAGIDYAALSITEHEEVSRSIDFERTGPWRDAPLFISPVQSTTAAGHASSSSMAAWHAHRTVITTSGRDKVSDRTARACLPIGWSTW